MTPVKADWNVASWSAAVLTALLAGCAGTSMQSGYPRMQEGAASFKPGVDGVQKSVDEKRGNTPPGKDRAGSDPASGAIVDPAGVISR